MTIQAFRGAQKVKGIIFLRNKKNKKLSPYSYSLGVKNDMLRYKKSSSHIKAMQSFNNIATGKIYSYETNLIPSWDKALERFNNEAHEV